MADKSFGVDQLDILGTGTPTISAPNQLNLECNTVAISTSVTVGQNLTVSANAGIASLNVTGIATVVNFNATGISTIASPSDTNSHSRWKVSNNGSSAYRFTGPGQDGSENNPNVYLVRGQRYIFDVNASGHPFQLRVANGGAAYSDGVTNNGAQSGQVIFNVQHDAPAQLYYQCTNHGSMVGNIYVVGGPQVISGVLTATSFSGSGANLTSLPAQATIANNADNRVITGGSGVNLNGEASLTYNGLQLNISNDVPELFLTDTNSNNSYGRVRGNGGNLILSADVNNATGSSVIVFEMDGAEKARIDTSGRFGIGTNNPDSLLHVYGATTGYAKIETGDGSTNPIIMHKNPDRMWHAGLRGDASDGYVIRDATASSNRLTIDTSGNTHFGTGGLNDSNTVSIIPADGRISFGMDGRTSLVTGESGAYIFSGQGASGSILAGELVLQSRSNQDRDIFFATGSSPTMRAKFRGSDGDFFLGNDLGSITSVGTAIRENDGSLQTYMEMGHSATGAGYSYFICRHGASGTNIGGIAQNSSGNGVTFNTSSDYRLKTNEALITDGITKIKQLKPYRFEWKSDLGTKVDGFFAHEVSSIVPEAITGTKDAVETTYYDDEKHLPKGKSVGDVKETDRPVYQKIDQSKLVPLLTAALQEAITKIETLETKVATLEGS